MNLNLRQSTYAEDLAAAHVLQQVAHHQVWRGLYVCGGNPNNLCAVINEGSRIRLNREPNHVEMRVALRIGFARSFKNQLLADRAVFRTKDKSNWFIITVLN